jgi:hypothetical protein
MNLTTNAREDMPLVAGYGQRSPVIAAMMAPA